MSSGSSPALNPVKKFPSTPHGDALIVPVAAFLARVAPPLRHDLDAAGVVNDLLCTSKRWPVIQNGRWRVFAQDPADLVKPRTRRYKGLENIVEAIHRGTGAVEAPYLLHQRSQRAMGSADRGEHGLPDVCFSRGHRARDWTEVVAFGELHEKDLETALEENVMKVTASMHRCMQNDARRRFVYAFTINNSAMRLWFCDRSQILVTEPFNFITDHRSVVHFFLSVMYASPSGLGFDPTVALSEDGRHYDIKIRSKEFTQTYRTLRLLSSSRIPLIGKGTRVWKAVRVDRGKEVGVPVVLKDTWTSPYLDSEGTVLKKLLDDLEQNHSQAHSFFTSIEGYEDVYLNDECTILDWINTFTLAETTRAPPMTCRADLMDKGSAEQPRYVHHHIIYKDLCRSLHSETSLVQFFKHLDQITRALQTMHLAGWVHRDVSPANILVKDDGMALLADLEYAKCIGIGSEGKTGTPGFLALEAEVGRYRFPPPKNPPPQPSSSKYTLMERLRGMKDGKPISDEMAKPDLFYREEDGEDLPAVRYNPLHDLESVWWIAVYFVVTHEVHNADGAEGESFVAPPMQRRYAAELFTDIVDVVRQAALFDLGAFMDDMVRIDGLPRVPHDVALALDCLREVLVAQYRDIEKDVSAIGSTSAGPLYDNFCEIFELLATDPRLQKCTLHPFTLSLEEERALPSIEQRHRKRKRTGTDDAECEDDPGRGRPRPRQYLPRAAKAPRRHA